MIVVNEGNCVGCGQCLLSCPEDAIWVWGVAEVKEERCVDCLVCIDYCPVDALEVKR